MQILEIIQKKKICYIYEIQSNIILIIKQDKIVKTILNIIKFMIQEDVIFIKHKWLSIVKKNNSKLIYIKS